MFFCDCGAKEDGSCKALVKRTPAGDGSSGSPLSPQRGEKGFFSATKKRCSSHVRTCLSLYLLPRVRTCATGVKQSVCLSVYLSVVCLSSAQKFARS
jgi:hypothetical protein